MPDLVEASCRQADALSRLAAMQALGDIVRAHPDTAAEAVPALLRALKDAEALVRAGAAEALGSRPGTRPARNATRWSGLCGAPSPTAARWCPRRRSGR